MMSSTLPFLHHPFFSLRFESDERRRKDREFEICIIHHPSSHSLEAMLKYGTTTLSNTYNVQTSACTHQPKQSENSASDMTDRASAQINRCSALQSHSDGSYDGPTVRWYYSTVWNTVEPALFWSLWTVSSPAMIVCFVPSFLPACRANYWWVFLSCDLCTNGLTIDSNLLHWTKEQD